MNAEQREALLKEGWTAEQIDESEITRLTHKIGEAYDDADCLSGLTNEEPRLVKLAVKRRKTRAQIKKEMVDIFHRSGANTAKDMPPVSYFVSRLDERKYSMTNDLFSDLVAQIRKEMITDLQRQGPR